MWSFNKNIPNMRKLPILLLLLASTHFVLTAQRTQVYQEAQLEFKRGMDFYEKDLFALAQQEFDMAAKRLKTPADHETQVLKTQIAMMYALSSVRMEQPHGEQLVMNFVRENQGTTMANRALYDLGSYFYAKREYEKASEAFSQIEGSGLSAEQMGEVRFKQGYGHFVKQRFAAAKTAFASVRQNSGDNYYPANYYYGMSSFYLKQYKDAVAGFKAASGSKRYAAQVPIYIIQIHFAQKEYDEVIAYGEKVLQESNVQKKVEIGQIVGQAYFERGEFAKALPYLNEYADKNSNLSESESYQIGYVNYQAGNYDKAIQHLRKASTGNSEMGQLATYYLGECYLKTGDKALARNAFSKAAAMTFRKDIQEDAAFQHGKLLVELRADKEAVQTLMRFDSSTKYYSESQKLIMDILLETNDFDFAISTIEKMSNRSAGFNEAYQKACYNKAVSLYDGKQTEEALVFFDKSLQYPVDARLKAMATYWKGDIFHQQKKYDQSLKEMNQFFLLEKAVSLKNPDFVHMANYVQGYNYIKKNDHQTALGFFEKAMEGIKKNQTQINDPLIRNNIFGDAVLRAGDCHFKRNRYREANRFYNEAYANKYSGYDYALFQKAIISGLERNNQQKISQLEELVRIQPNSSYADDALYELSFAYENEGELRKSRDVLERLVNEYRKNSNLVNASYLKLGLLAYNSGDKQNALTNYKNVFKNNPSREESEAALKAIEEIYVADLGKPDEYFKFLETIPGYNVRSDAKDSLTFRVAQVQFENGNYDRAIPAYSDYLSKYPNGGYALQALYNRAESYLVQKNYSAALKDYEQLISKGQSAYLIKSIEKAAIISYNYSEDFKKALDYYGRMEELATASEMRFEAQLGAMRSAFRSDNAQATIKYAEKVYQNPLSKDDQKANARYYKGKMHHKSGEWTLAIAAFQEVTRILDNETGAESAYLIADAHFKLKDFTNAETEARKVLESYAAYGLYVARSLILLSDVSVQNKDWISARAALEAVIENFDEDQSIVNEAKNKLKTVAELEQKDAAGSKRKNTDEIDFNDFNRNR
jgi:tetratricopeptide (TPR) repeat protein